MKFYTAGRQFNNTTPSASYQNAASWNIHDLVLKIVIFSSSQVYTICTVFPPRGQISALLVCPGVKIITNEEEEKVCGCVVLGGVSTGADLNPQTSPVWCGDFKHMCTYSGVAEGGGWTAGEGKVCGHFSFGSARWEGAPTSCLSRTQPAWMHTDSAVFRFSFLPVFVCVVKQIP